MDIPIQYAYITGVGIFALIWLAFFLIKKSIRREMLILSVLASVMGFSQFFFTYDYWQPASIFGSGRLDFESFLLSFLYGGVAAPLYEILFWKKPNYSSKPGNPVWGLVAVVLSGVALSVGVFGLGWNSLYVSSGILIILGISMIAYRPALLKHGLYTGALFALLMFLVLQILAGLFPDIVGLWWKLDNLSGYFVLGIPIEELLSAFSWGFLAGPASELVARTRLPAINAKIFQKLF